MMTINMVYEYRRSEQSRVGLSRAGQGIWYTIRGGPVKNATWWVFYGQSKAARNKGYHGPRTARRTTTPTPNHSPISLIRVAITLYQCHYIMT